MDAQEYRVMGKEDKHILLKSFCEALHYHTICHTHNGDYELLGIDIEKEEVRLDSPIYDEGDDIYGLHCYGDVMPYIRPMSSMTDEETAQVQMFMDIVTDENYGDGYSPSAWDAMNGFVQYCDSHHLDHRGLIPMGLALPAPEGMYKTQNK